MRHMITKQIVSSSEDIFDIIRNERTQLITSQINITYPNNSTRILYESWLFTKSGNDVIGVYENREEAEKEHYSLAGKYNLTKHDIFAKNDK